MTRTEFPWRDLDEPFETAMAALGGGRCMVRLGDGAGAERVLRDARERFADLGAAALEETDALLAEVLASGLSS